MIMMIIHLVVAVVYYRMIFFLWMICCTLKTCLIFSVPQKDSSNRKAPLIVRYSPLVSDLQASLRLYLCFSGHGFHERNSVTRM